MHLTSHRYIKRFVLVLVTALLLTAQFAQWTPAEAGVTPTSGSSLVGNCDSYPGITNRIVKCVRTTLDNVSAKFFTGFYPLIAKFVTGFMTLAVIIYGVMMAMGMVEKIGRDSMVFLLKIAFVAYFVQNADMAYQWIIQAMDSLSATMFTFATVNHPTAPVCMVGKASIWERLDCLMDTLIGLKTATIAGSDATSNVQLSGNGLARGLIAFFASAIFSSVPGFLIGLIGFMFLYTMLFFLVKVLFIFLTSYMAILFLMILGPIFMPLVIFRTTKQYFDNWVGLVISCALQPVIVVAFVSFAVAGIDVAVFSGEKSFVRTIAGDDAKAAGFNLNEYIESKGGYKKETIGPEMIAESSDAVATNATPQQGGLGTMLTNECGLDSAAATPSVTGTVGALQECAEGWVVGLNVHAIDWTALAKERNPAVTVPTGSNITQAFENELYASAILTAVLVFIMNALMRVVPQIANDLVGSYRQTPNLFASGGSWKWQQQGGKMADSMANQMRGGQSR